LKLHVGCCGFPIPQRKYVVEFDVVELQSTFYRIPRLSTAKKWRDTAPKDFIFTVKAFQGITHSINSPTWKRSNIRPTPNHGEFRPTQEVYESWKITRQICDILSAPITILQTPPTFKDTEENLKNVEAFFDTIDRGKLLIGLEPRGWQKESIIKICKKFELIHVTDPFQSSPVYTLNGRVSYFRLHGSPPGKRMYSYKYTNDDLQRLKKMINSLKTDEVYILFNNISMYEDAKRFVKLFT